MSYVIQVKINNFRPGLMTNGAGTVLTFSEKESAEEMVRCYGIRLFTCISVDGKTIMMEDIAKLSLEIEEQVA